MKYINLIFGLCLWGVSIIPAELSALMLPGSAKEKSGPI